MPATVPDDVAKALQSGGAPPAGLSADEKYVHDQLEPQLFTQELRESFRPLRTSGADAMGTGSSRQ